MSPSDVLQGPTELLQEGSHDSSLQDPPFWDIRSILEAPVPSPVPPPPLHTQDIVPGSLLQHFLSMTDPMRAETVDSELSRHCAYSLPAVALTLGRSNWPVLRDTYEALAADMHWKVRRTLAFSIHHLAAILGRDIAQSDLLPVFNGFIKDLDEVRIGVLKHLGHFLRMLRPQNRRDFLPRMDEFLRTDNENNWRFRLELALQLGEIIELFSPHDCQTFLVPITLVLMADKVVHMRRTCYAVVSGRGRSWLGSIGRVILARYFMRFNKFII